MASLSVYTTVILVCPAVLERVIPSTSSSGTTIATTTTEKNAISTLATSLSSTPTVTSSFPTSTSFTLSAPTLSSGTPGPSASPGPSSSAPSYVLVPIHTTVSIDVFPPSLSPGSRQGYVPTYEAHRDVSSLRWITGQFFLIQSLQGSLTTSLFDAKVRKLDSSQDPVPLFLNYRF